MLTQNPWYHSSQKSHCIMDRPLFPAHTVFLLIIILILILGSTIVRLSVLLYPFWQFSILTGNHHHNHDGIPQFHSVKVCWQFFLLSLRGLSKVDWAYEISPLQMLCPEGKWYLPLHMVAIEHINHNYASSFSVNFWESKIMSLLHGSDEIWYMVIMILMFFENVWKHEWCWSADFSSEHEHIWRETSTSI